MKNLIEKFLSYMAVEKALSPKTISAYRHDLNKFCVFINDKDITKISKDDIREFLNYLANTGYKNKNSIVTRARKLSTIKSFFKYLTKEEIVEINPAFYIDSPKISETEASHLTTEEYYQLIDTVKQNATSFYKLRDLTIITLFLSTGLRLSELTNLRLNDISLNNKSIRVTRKGGKEQGIPLTIEANELLKRYIKDRPKIDTQSIFISRKRQGMRSNTIYYMVKKYLNIAHINNPDHKVTVHSLRHTFCTILLGQKVDLFTIQQLAGHKNLETTKKYLHIDSSQLREAVNLIKL